MNSELFNTFWKFYILLPLEVICFVFLTVKYIEFLMEFIDNVRLTYEEKLYREMLSDIGCAVFITWLFSIVIGLLVLCAKVVYF